MNLLLCGMACDPHHMLSSIWFGSLGVLGRPTEPKGTGKGECLVGSHRIDLLGWVWHLVRRDHICQRWEGNERVLYTLSYKTRMQRCRRKSRTNTYPFPSFLGFLSHIWLNVLSPSSTWTEAPAFTSLLPHHGVCHPSGVCHCLPANNHCEKVSSQ